MNDIKKAIETKDIRSITDHLIKLRNEEFNASRDPAHPVKSFFKNLSKGERVFVIADIISVALMVAVTILEKINVPYHDGIQVGMIIAILIAAIIMVFTSFRSTIDDSTGYLYAIKAECDNDEMMDMTEFLMDKIGITSCRMLDDLIDELNYRKKLVESYRENKGATITSFISGIAAIAGAASLFKRGISQGNFAFVVIALILTFGAFIVYLFKKYSMSDYWSDRDEEVLNLLYMIRINAEYLGFVAE